MEVIETKRLLLRPFRETDYDDLYEFLSQQRNAEFEAYPGLTYESCGGLLEKAGFRREALFRKDISFRKDAAGEPIWSDTFVYAMLESDQERN